MHSSAQRQKYDQQAQAHGELPVLRDFFVSYSNEDREQAERIASALEGDGKTVYMQSQDFGAGGNFMRKVDEAAANSGCMLSVLSPAYLRSDFCTMEWRAQLAQDPTGSNLFPVRIALCNPTGMLAAIAYIDLVGIVPEERAHARLLNDLKKARMSVISPRTQWAAIAYGIVMGHGMGNLKRLLMRMAFLAAVFASISFFAWLFMRTQFPNARESDSLSLIAGISVFFGMLATCVSALAPRIWRLLAFRRWSAK